MPPLTRPPSPDSVHSWWSDSNPRLQGATINLHTLTKPLLRRMHHRQALAFIEKNRRAPLSREILDTFTSYFPWNYISLSTKAAILIGLTERAKYENDAQVIIGDSFFLVQESEFLGSSSPEVRECACRLVGTLAAHELVMPTILASGLCVQLASLLRDSVGEVVRGAVYALEEIARWPDGAQVVVDATVLNLLEELLGWSDVDVRRITCRLVGNLAAHIESFVPSVLLCMTLVSLLRDDQVINRATDALTKVAQRHHGARVLSRTKVLDYVPELLDSSDTDVRICSCSLVGNLARYEGIPPTVLEGKLCTHLASLLRDGHVEVIEQATYALMHIAHWPDGAQAVFDAKVPYFFQELLESSNADVQQISCRLVGNLAGHIKPFVPNALKSKLCMELVSLLCDSVDEVVQWAAYALAEISRWPDGAQAVVDAKLPDILEELLECSNADVRRITCWLVGNLAAHIESFVPKVMKSKLCMEFVSLLHDGQVVNRATYALKKISRWPDGAQILSGTQVLDYVPELLESSDADVRKCSCSLVGNLARHESIPPNVLDGELCTRLASLLRDGHVEVIEQATYALGQISHWPDGAQAVIDAQVPDFLQELLA
ncbi:armadillo-type protein [Mycena galericulata]|nr:armadillo-type protein [Mycena galericulata]